MIEILNISKAYAGSGAQAVSGLTLSVPEGEFLVLIGPSGSGKTTTLNMVNRLVEPDGGEIRIQGHNVLDSDPVLLRRGIGYVFQEAGLFPHMSVAENIAVTPRLLGWDAARIDARVNELLALVQLEQGGIRDRPPQELSGGQRQRVALARALAARPPVLLLDEPFGALDPVTREAVAADVRDIHQRLGLTTLMVTHDMTEALLDGGPHRGDAQRPSGAGGHAPRTGGAPGRRFRRPADRNAAPARPRPGRNAQRMNASFREAWALLPDYLGQHVILSVSALLLGVAISLPLGIAAARSARFGTPLLAFVSVVQTIPGLALLALFYPLLLALSVVTQDLFGFSIRALGFLPALLALTLYAMLPILRNLVTALANIDPAILMAAKGVGMTPRQSLFKVELPLAAPLVLAGIRTATVWVVGITTLSTPIGQTSLGNYIFTGLADRELGVRAVRLRGGGGIGAGLDLLLAMAGSGLASHSRSRLILAGLGLLAVIAAALAPELVHDAIARAATRYRDRGQEFRRAIYPGRTDDPAPAPRRLRRHHQKRSGIDHCLPGLGRRRHRRLCRLFRHLVGQCAAPDRHAGPPGHAGPADRRAGRRRITESRLGSLGFENAYIFAMRADRAQALHITSLADLAAHPELRIGGDFEIFSRPEWRAVAQAYGLGAMKRRQYQPDFLYRAVVSGDADVVSAFSSDGRIARYGLVILADPKAALPPYDAMLLVGPAHAHDAQFIATLKPLIGSDLP